MANKHSVDIILVEDDSDLCESLVDCLGLHGYSVTGVPTALTFYQTISVRHFDIAIIDIGLPDQSGLEIVSHLKKNNAMGIVVLTAMDSPEVRIDGYERGADLYLVKPVECRELAAALSNLVMRLGKHKADAEVKNDNSLLPWILTPVALQLTAPCGEHIALSFRETRFLERLMNQSGLQVNRIDLQRYLNILTADCSDRRMDSMIRRLRRKVKTSSGADLPIQTIYGEGYIFSAQSHIA